MSLTGPENAPTPAGVVIDDYSSGIFAALGAMLALFERQYSNSGQFVEATLLDSMAFMMGHNFVKYRRTKTVERGRSQRGLNGTFLSKDGPYIVILGNNDRR